MPRKKKTNGDQPIGIGLTTKQMKRKKPIGNTYLLDIEPITDNQKKLFDSYADGKHLVACLLYTSPSPRDRQKSRMPSSA